MSKAKLPQYNGGLDASQIARGMNAACRNARRLADDASLLLDAGRIPLQLRSQCYPLKKAGRRASSAALH
jgi:hypothetical protein